MLFYTPRGPFLDDPRGMGRTVSERILEGPREYCVSRKNTCSHRAQVFYHLAFSAVCLDVEVYPGLQVNITIGITDIPIVSKAGTVL